MISLRNPPPAPEPMGKGTMAGIVIGCLLVLVVVVVASYPLIKQLFR